MVSFDFWGWKRDVEATLLAQCLLRPNGSANTPSHAARYGRHVWVSPAAGLNDNAADRGNFDVPFRSLAAAADAIGPPVSAEDFLTPWTIHVQHGGPVDEGAAVVTLPSTRRLTIHAPGCVLPPLRMSSEKVLKFGSGAPAELHVRGDAGNVWFNRLLPQRMSPGVCRVGDGANAITLHGEPGGGHTFVLGLQHVDCTGLIHASGGHNVASPVCLLGDSAFSGPGFWGEAGPAGAGTGLILQADRCAFVSLPYQVRVQAIAGMTDSIVACAIRVEDAGVRRHALREPCHANVSGSHPPGVNRRGHRPTRFTLWLMNLKR